MATFLAQKESECANILFGTNDGNAQSPPPQTVEAISENLQIVDSIRRELDDAILRREQLNQMGAELCAQPGNECILLFYWEVDNKKEIHLFFVGIS